MSKKSRLQHRAEKLIHKHGSIRKAAVAIGVSPSTLMRYKTGSIKEVTYWRISFLLNSEVGE